MPQQPKAPLAQTQRMPLLQKLLVLLVELSETDCLQERFALLTAGTPTSDRQVEEVGSQPVWDVSIIQDIRVALLADGLAAVDVGPVLDS